MATENESTFEATDEERCDEIYVKWQRKWTDAKGEAESNRAVGALNALQDIYEVFGWETP